MARIHGVTVDALHPAALGAPRGAAVARQCALAVVREVRAEWTTLLDPERKAFCVRDPRRG